jgi:hypothetical protein
VGVAYDYRANGLSDGSYENALAGYLLWQAASKLKLNGRVDYATGSDGAYGVTVAPGKDNVRLLSGVATVDYALWAKRHQPRRIPLGPQPQRPGIVSRKRLAEKRLLARAERHLQVLGRAQVQTGSAGCSFIGRAIPRAGGRLS